MVNYTKPETKKRMCDSKENRSTVISKDDYGNTVLIVIVVHLAYGSHFLQKASVTLSYDRPFACKCQASYSQLDL